LPFISSANIACGFHAGDPSVMRQTVQQAIMHGVAIGAHPGLPDLQGFGRRHMTLSPQEIYDIIIVQVGALMAVAQSQNAKVCHVKPHGALYNMASSDQNFAKAICTAVKDINADLVLFALSGSTLAKVGESSGLKVAHEVFADRTYQSNGQLTARSHPRALITDIETSINQALSMIDRGVVTALDGSKVSVKADTICLHGDQPQAAEFAAKLIQVFKDKGIKVSAPVS